MALVLDKIWTTQLGWSKYFKYSCQHYISYKIWYMAKVPSLSRPPGFACAVMATRKNFLEFAGAAHG